jgi:2-C-methyl-D-erythritol 2,4-cyclodiphosphate synthase
VPAVGEYRTGLGFDVHPRTAGRALLLGGVRFEGEDGLAGHSDGDAVCHALADGLLGAAGLGDVGEHFPDTDPEVAGIAGLELLRRTVEKVRAAGLLPDAADVTVIAIRPSVAPARARMRERLAEALGVPVARVSVKATRPEGLGLTGDGIGCLALAVLRTG